MRECPRQCPARVLPKRCLNLSRGWISRVPFITALPQSLEYSKLLNNSAHLTRVILAFWVISFASQSFSSEKVIDIAVAAAPGSAEPNLTKGPEGTIVLSWLEPAGKKTRLQYSRLESGGWSEPRTVAESDSWFVNWADFPSVVPISDSLWAAHWLSKRKGGTYAYDVTISLSRDAGATWSASLSPHRDNTATEHGFVSLFPWQDGVGVVWLDGRNTSASGSNHDHDKSGGMTLRSAVITPQGRIKSEAEMDKLVCDCCQTGVAISSLGPVAVYRNRTESEIRDIYLARSVNNQWLEGKPVSEDQWEISGCPVNGPAVVASEETVAVAWFTMAGDTPRVRFAWSHDGGQSFEPAINIAEESPNGRVDLAILDDDSAIISWLDQSEDGKGLIRLRRVLPDNRLGAVKEIAQTVMGRPAGFPKMVQDGDSLLMAWTDTSAKKSRVKSARIKLVQTRDAGADW